jgi:hypothetical protein
MTVNENVCNMMHVRDGWRPCDKFEGWNEKRGSAQARSSEAGRVSDLPM